MENIKIGIGVVVALLIQASGLVYWAAQQASTLEQLQTTVAKLEDKIQTADMINLKRDVQEIQEDFVNLGPQLARMNNDIFNSATFGELEKLREDMEENLDELEEKIEQMEKKVKGL